MGNTIHGHYLIIECDILVAVLSDCPSNFTWMPSVNGCYKLVISRYNWDVSAQTCIDLYPSVHLVIIDNDAEQQAVTDLVSSLSSTCLD